MNNKRANLLRVIDCRSSIADCGLIAEPHRPSAVVHRRFAVLNCLVATLALAVLGGFAGCIWEREDKGRADLGVAPATAGGAFAALFRDTIGARCYYDAVSTLPVRGYGLVVGLGTSGSRDCPKKVREQLVEALYKQRRRSGGRVGAVEITPEELLSDLDTAVVVVRGAIPVGATVGTVMDVAVRALPGTQTRSLRGGRLYPMELQRFRMSAPGTVTMGRTLARAAGPVFLNPFSDDASATQANPREGIILGGGVVTVERETRLILMEPSHARATQIQDRINVQFPGSIRVADAGSPAFVALRVPPEFEHDTAHFLALVRRLYLSRDPQIETNQARALAESMVRSGAPHGRIALCLEGLGRAALPVLGALYADGNEAVSFAAAAAGLRLGDHIACDAVEMHAQNPTGEVRFRAIRALAAARSMGGAAMVLRRLLSDDDPRVQIAAYEGLLQRGDATVASKHIARDNFILDRVPTAHRRSSAGAHVPRPRNFVYVKRTRSRRIALFGTDLRCSAPLFYRAPDGSVTLTASPGDERLTVLRVAVATGSTSPPIPAHFDLAGLIELMGGDAEIDHNGEVVGLGLDYGAVVRALYYLCEDGSANAKFILEQPNALELFGQPRPAGRPES